MWFSVHPMESGELKKILRLPNTTSWSSNTLATWCEGLTHWKRPWCWERLKAGGKGDNREWDGWMASPTQWTWVWVSSRSCQWTWKPGVLQSIGLQRVGHAWATELNWTDDRSSFSFVRNLYAILHSGYFSSHSHQQYRRAPFSPHPLHCLLFVDFWCWPFWLVWSDTSM